MPLLLFGPGYRCTYIAFQKMFLARLEGGDHTFRISPTDNAAKDIFWKAIVLLNLYSCAPAIFLL